MSAPLAPSKVESQLKRWGINYAAYKADWSKHNRGDRGNGFSNINGLIIHHTGSDAKDQRSYLYSGDAALPGPLCHFHIDTTGKLWLIGWGRANHAGGGDQAVLNHVISEDYTGTLTTHFGEGDKGAFDGNGRFYGVEIGYSGSHEMSAAQYATLMKLCAAIAEAHKWTEKSFIMHYEWNKYKWDPGCGPKSKRYSASVIRSDIKKTIDAGPKPEDDVKDKPPVTTNPPASTPSKPKPNPQTYTDVWNHDAAKPPVGHATTANPTWAPASILRFVAEAVDRIEKKLDAFITEQKK